MNYIKATVDLLLKNPSSAIWKLASIVGSVMSIFPAVPLGKLQHRALEKHKIHKAKSSSVNKHAIDDLEWWVGAIPNAENNINTPKIHFEINIDASETRWAGADGSNPIYGFWSEDYKTYHISYLELLVIKHAIMNCEDIWKGYKYINAKSDNDAV